MVTENSGTVTALKPGVGAAYGNGWRQLWKSAHFGWLLLILIILGALSSIPSAFQFILAGPSMFMPADEMLLADDMLLPGGNLMLVGATMLIGFFSLLYSVFFLGPLEYGVNYAFLRAARADSVSVEDMFACFKNYWNAVGASLLVGIIVAVGMIFLIAPGIYLACKLAFVPYLVIDKKMRLGDAFSTSWRMTAGHGWKVFLIGLLSIPIFIAGFICLVVGVVIAAMWVNTAYASLYHAVDMEKGAVDAAEAAV